jgi:hypothetical protein
MEIQLLGEISSKLSRDVVPLQCIDLGNDHLDPLKGFQILANLVPSLGI